MAKNMTKKQEIFVAEYLTDLNATRAAIAAGYSKKGAEQTGSVLLRNPKVAELIATKSEKRLQKLEISAEKVLQEIAKLAFFDPRKLFDKEGRPLSVPELDDDTAMAVAGLEVYEEYSGQGEDRKAIGLTRKIKIADKGINLERLGKHLKLFTDKVQVEGDMRLEIRDVKQKLLAKLSGR